MFHLKTLLILSAILTVCYCDKVGHYIKHKKHHYKHLFFREFHYLIFLALKFKFILAIGTIWTIAVVVGKIFAMIKLFDYMKRTNDVPDHHEKIVIANPDDYHGGIYGKSYITGDSLGPDITFDQPSFGPDRGDSYSTSYSLNRPPLDYPTSAQGSTYEKYGRSSDEGLDITNYFRVFERIVRQMGVTERVFKDMNVKGTACKRKFICEADFNANQSMILKAAFNILSDMDYEKYRTNHTVQNIDECAKLNENCK